MGLTYSSDNKSELRQAMIQLTEAFVGYCETRQQAPITTAINKCLVILDSMGIDRDIVENIQHVLEGWRDVILTGSKCIPKSRESAYRLKRQLESSISRAQTLWNKLYDAGHPLRMMKDQLVEIVTNYLGCILTEGSASMEKCSNLGDQFTYELEKSLSSRASNELMRDDLFVTERRKNYN